MLQNYTKKFKGEQLLLNEQGELLNQKKYFNEFSPEQRRDMFQLI